MEMLFNQIIYLEFQFLDKWLYIVLETRKLEDVENVYLASLMYKLLSDNEEDMMIVYKKRINKCYRYNKTKQIIKRYPRKRNYFCKNLFKRCIWLC